MKSERGVILLSHIPHGFFEQQMFDFFSQFGEVTRLKLIRSKKTGRSKHIAFIEFEFEEIAKIAAQTMNNYLMFQKILKCKLIPNEEVKPLTFKNWNREFRLGKSRAKATRMHNKTLTDPEKIEKRKSSHHARRLALQQKLKDLGIDYDVLNIKVNESFIMPERPRASKEDIEKWRSNENRKDGKGSSNKQTGFSKEPEIKSEDREEDCKTKKNEEHSGTKETDAQEKSNENRKKRKGKLGKQTGSTKKPAIKSEGREEDCETKENEEHSKTKETDAQQHADDFGVMVTDLDDSEITFRSPPPGARIKRKSIGIVKGTKAGKHEDTKLSSEDNGKPLKRKKGNKVAADDGLEDNDNIASTIKLETTKDLSTPAKVKRSKKSSPMTERKKRLEKRRKLNETM